MRDDRRRRGGFEPRGFAPVKVGDELDVTVEAVGEKGDGVAKKDGFVLFVPGTKQGDKVKVKITRVLRKVGFAEVIDASSSEKQEQQEQQEEYESGATEDTAEEEHTSEDSEDFGEEEDK